MSDHENNMENWDEPQPPIVNPPGAAPVQAPMQAQPGILNIPAQGNNMFEGIEDRGNNVIDDLRVFPEPVVPLAPCENIVFFHKHLSANPLCSLLICRNINSMPMIGNWRYTIALTMAYITSYARALVLGEDRPDRDLVYSVTMAELIGPYLPERLIADEAESRRQLRASVAYLLNTPHHLAVVSTGTVAVYNQLSLDALCGIPGLGPFRALLALRQQNDSECPTIQAAIRILLYISATGTSVSIVPGLNLIAHIVVAICKRGTVSEEFLNKITDGIETDLGKRITLKPESISAFYRHFATYITDVSMPYIRNTWIGLIPENALRLTLTIGQIAGSGLTSFITIGRAIRMYPDFKWALVYRLFPVEWNNFLAAEREVAGNSFYGFRKDLGPVRSTRYKSLSYVAKELLIKAGGEAALSRYQGWPSRIAYKTRVDEIIAEYIRRKSEQLTAEETDANTLADEAFEVNGMVAVVTAEQNRQIFS